MLESGGERGVSALFSSRTTPLPEALCSSSEPRSRNLAGHAGQGGGACCYRDSSAAWKNQMSWLPAGRAYVIKLSHDKQSRAGVRAKNCSFALVKCRIRRLLLSHTNSSSNFSPRPTLIPSPPSPSPAPPPHCLLNLEFDVTHPSTPEAVLSPRVPSSSASVSSSHSQKWPSQDNK